MLFGGQKRTLDSIVVVGSALSICVCTLVCWLGRTTFWETVVLLLQLEGTVLLASSIRFDIPGIGNTFREKVKWFLFESPNYRSPPSFSPLLFYFGLAFLFCGTAISAWI